MSEADIMRAIQLAVTPTGARCFRNNIGVLKDDKGRYVRFGVGGNGGSDLIGFTPILVTPALLGRTVPLFTAIEVKKPGEKPTDEQTLFINLVLKAGGVAGVAESVEQAIQIILRS